MSLSCLWVRTLHLVAAYFIFFFPFLFHFSIRRHLLIKLKESNTSALFFSLQSLASHPPYRHTINNKFSAQRPGKRNQSISAPSQAQPLEIKQVFLNFVVELALQLECCIMQIRDPISSWKKINYCSSQVPLQVPSVRSLSLFPVCLSPWPSKCALYLSVSLSLSVVPTAEKLQICVTKDTRDESDGSAITLSTLSLALTFCCLLRYTCLFQRKTHSFRGNRH